MGVLLMTWAIGALVIMGVAWVLRKLVRASLTPRSAVLSVIAAGVISTLLNNFGEGEGGFDNRVENLLSLDRLLYEIPQSAIALAILALLGWRAALSRVERRLPD